MSQQLLRRFLRFLSSFNPHRNSTGFKETEAKYLTQVPKLTCDRARIQARQHDSRTRPLPPTLHLHPVLKHPKENVHMVHLLVWKCHDFGLRHRMLTIRENSISLNPTHHGLQGMPLFYIQPRKKKLGQLKLGHRVFLSHPL